MKNFTVQIKCPVGCAMKLANLSSLVRHLQACHKGWLERIDDGGDLGTSTFEVSVIVSLLDDRG
jgi:hypothetical protein